MPSLLATPPAYFDTCERTLRSEPRIERPKEVDPTWLNVANSRVLRQNDKIETLQANILELSLWQNNWNGYGSPRPSIVAIAAARAIVNRFQTFTVLPEKATASADGGVALIFVGQDKQRAVIESFGTEDDYILLYDTEGSSRTLPWPQEEEAQNEVLTELQSYLRGIQVAPRS